MLHTEVDRAEVGVARNEIISSASNVITNRTGEVRRVVVKHRHGETSTVMPHVIASAGSAAAAAAAAATLSSSPFMYNTASAARNKSISQVRSSKSNSRQPFGNSMGVTPSASRQECSVSKTALNDTPPSFSSPSSSSATRHPSQQARWQIRHSITRNQFDGHRSFSRSRPHNASGGWTAMDEERRRIQRDKQVSFGFLTTGYQNMQRLCEVDPVLKSGGILPIAPPNRDMYSKRIWDLQLRKWRRALHMFDHVYVDGVDDSAMRARVLNEQRYLWISDEYLQAVLKAEQEEEYKGSGDEAEGHVRHKPGRQEHANRSEQKHEQEKQAASVVRVRHSVQSLWQVQYSPLVPRTIPIEDELMWLLRSRACYESVRAVVPQDVCSLTKRADINPSEVGIKIHVAPSSAVLRRQRELNETAMRSTAAHGVPHSQQGFAQTALAREASSPSVRRSSHETATLRMPTRSILKESSYEELATVTDANGGEDYMDEGNASDDVLYRRELSHTQAGSKSKNRHHDDARDEEVCELEGSPIPMRPEVPHRTLDLYTATTPNSVPDADIITEEENEHEYEEADCGHIPSSLFAADMHTAPDDEENKVTLKDAENDNNKSSSLVAHCRPCGIAACGKDAAAGGGVVGILEGAHVWTAAAREASSTPYREASGSAAAVAVHTPSPHLHLSCAHAHRVRFVDPAETATTSSSLSPSPAQRLNFASVSRSNNANGAVAAGAAMAALLRESSCVAGSSMGSKHYGVEESSHASKDEVDRTDSRVTDCNAAGTSTGQTTRIIAHHDRCCREKHGGRNVHEMSEERAMQQAAVDRAESLAETNQRRARAAGTDENNGTTSNRSTIRMNQAQHGVGEVGTAYNTHTLIACPDKKANSDGRSPDSAIGTQSLRSQTRNDNTTIHLATTAPRSPHAESVNDTMTTSNAAVAGKDKDDDDDEKTSLWRRQKKAPKPSSQPHPHRVAAKERAELQARQKLCPARNEWSIKQEATATVATTTTTNSATISVDAHHTVRSNSKLSNGPPPRCSRSAVAQSSATVKERCQKCSSPAAAVAPHGDPTNAHAELENVSCDLHRDAIRHQKVCRWISQNHARHHLHPPQRVQRQPHDSMHEQPQQFAIEQQQQPYVHRHAHPHFYPPVPSCVPPPPQPYYMCHSQPCMSHMPAPHALLPNPYMLSATSIPPSWAAAPPISYNFPCATDPTHNTPLMALPVPSQPMMVMGACPHTSCVTNRASYHQLMAGVVYPNVSMCGSQDCVSCWPSMHVEADMYGRGGMRMWHN